MAGLRRSGIIASLPKAAQANALYGTGKTRAPLWEAEQAANEIKNRLEFCIAGLVTCVRWPTYIVGSVRRKVPTVKDLDLLVVRPSKPSDTKSTTREILRSMRLRPVSHPKVKIMTVYARGSRKCGMVVRYRFGATTRYFHTDVFLATSKEKPFALFHWTGDTIYNVRTRALAKKHGMLLNQYGLFDAKTRKPVPSSEKIRTEKDLATMLGVSYRTPEQRNSPKYNTTARFAH